MLPDFFGSSLSQRRGEKPAVMERREHHVNVGIMAHILSLPSQTFSVSLGCLHKKYRSCIMKTKLQWEDQTRAALRAVKVCYSRLSYAVTEHTWYRTEGAEVFVSCVCLQHSKGSLGEPDPVQGFSVSFTQYSFHPSVTLSPQCGTAIKTLVIDVVHNHFSMDTYSVVGVSE